VEILVKPRQGRHHHDGSSRILMSPLPWLTLHSELRNPTAVRRGPSRSAGPLTRLRTGAEALRSALMGLRRRAHVNADQRSLPSAEVNLPRSPTRGKCQYFWIAFRARQRPLLGACTGANDGRRDRIGGDEWARSLLYHAGPPLRRTRKCG